MARPDPHFQSDPTLKDEATGGPSGARGPLIHVATRCTSVDEFVEKFASFASEGALVLPASGDLPIGTEGRFVILLRDRSVAMRGRCRVTDAKPAPTGVSGAGVRRTMLRVVLLEMDDATRAIHQRLLASQRPPVPIMVAHAVSEPTEVSPPKADPSSPRSVVPPPITVRPVVPPPVSAFAPTTIATLAPPPLRSVVPVAAPLRGISPSVAPAPPVTQPRAITPPVTPPRGITPPVTEPRAITPPVTPPRTPPVTKPRVSPPLETTRVVPPPETTRVAPPIETPPRETPPIETPPRETPPRETTARGPAPAPPSVSPRSAPTQTSGTPPVASRPAPPASAYARAPTLIGVPSARSADGTLARPSQDATVTAVAPQPQETRAPGASFTLPANPLSELGPEDLASFIDCTLFEADAADAEAIIVDDAGPTVEIDPLAPARPFVIPGPSAEELLSPALPPAVATTRAKSADLTARAGRLARRYGIPAAVAAATLLIGLAIPRGRHAPPPPAARVAAAPPAAKTAAAPPAQIHPASPAAEAPPAVPPPKPAPTPAAAGPAAKTAPATEEVAKETAAEAAKQAAAEKPAEKAAVEEQPPEKPAPVAKAAKRAAAPAAASAGEGTCVVRVATEPSDAKVLWGDKLIGVTPIDAARVPCGPASVTFRRDRWQPVTRDVVATADETTAVSQKLHRPTATLVLGSSPPHAEITVNGQSEGFTPKRISVSRFESVSIRVALAGYAPWKKTVYVREAETRLGTTLVRADGKRPAGR